MLEYRESIKEIKQILLVLRGVNFCGLVSDSSVFFFPQWNNLIWPPSAVTDYTVDLYEHANWSVVRVLYSECDFSLKGTLIWNSNFYAIVYFHEAPGSLIALSPQLHFQIWLKLDTSFKSWWDWLTDTQINEHGQHDCIKLFSWGNQNKNKLTLL